MLYMIAVSDGNAEIRIGQIEQNLEDFSKKLKRGSVYLMSKKI